MLFSENSTILFVGDSITDCGRARPVGQNEGLGFGYVNMVNAMLHASYPTLNLKVLNTGTSGDTTRNLKARWQTDVIDLKPDYLSIMIGINDVWRKFDSPNKPELAVGLEEYKNIYNELISGIKSKVKKIILMSPFMIEKNKEEPMMALLISYIDAVKKIAEENNFIFINLQDIFDDYLDKGMNPSMISGDKVHPSQTGSMIIAGAFLKNVNFEF